MVVVNYLKRKVKSKRQGKLRKAGLRRPRGERWPISSQIISSQITALDASPQDGFQASPITTHFLKSTLRRRFRPSNLRSPEIVANYLMQKQKLKKPVFHQSLANDVYWTTVFRSLRFKGIDQEDVAHWAWIVEAESADEMIARFVSTDIRKPIFLLLALLGRDKTILDPEAFGDLLAYVAAHFVAPRANEDQMAREAPSGSIRRATLNGFNLTLIHFERLMEGLVHHCLLVWPPAIVAVAELVVTYLRDYKANTTKCVIARNRIYNHAFRLFRGSTPLRPLENMRHNWEAMRTLLQYGNSPGTSLLLCKSSLKAVREVLLCQEKSDAERRITQRSVQTWPPYRAHWDGVDERRQREDFLSRSVKAGVESVRAGYHCDEYDRALDVLGGGGVDEHPTIQFRSHRPKRWFGRRESLNVYSTWAARVKATRNAQEAWRVFQSAPNMTIKPNYQVYKEMFVKLFAQKVPTWNDEVPGDSREVWEPYTGNFTKFELVRLQPPSLDQLYKQMLSGGNRPTGQCLVVLIYHADSLEKAMEYLRDSPYREDSLHLLTPVFSPPVVESVRRFPPHLLRAWIGLLCRLHRAIPGQESEIERAYQLALAVSDGNPTGTHNIALWHIILRAIAERNKMLLSQRGPGKNHHHTLHFFLRTCDQVRRLVKVDVIMLDLLAKILRKTLKRSAESEFVGALDAEMHGLARVASRTLKEGFREIVRPVSLGDGGILRLPSLYHEVDPRFLYQYLRAVTCYGDIDELVHVADWVLDTWDDDRILTEAKYKGTRDFDVVQNGVFGYIMDMADNGVVPAPEMQRLKQRMESLEPKTIWRNGICETFRWDWPKTRSMADERILGLDLEMLARWKSSMSS